MKLSLMIKRNVMRITAILSAVLLLSACGSTPKSSPSSASTNDKTSAEVKYKRKLEDFIHDPQAEDVSDLFDAYSQSSIVSNIWDVRDEFAEVQAQINNGEPCNRHDWEKLIRENVMRLQRHISAIECYQELGDEKALAKHMAIFEALISGIGEDKTGDDYTVAYRVLVEEDAEEFLNLAGYHVISMEYELIEGDDGLYLVYTVEDQETGKQEQVYFDNRLFLQNIYELEAPQTAHKLMYTKNYLREMRDYNFAAFAGLADGYLVNWSNTDVAVSQYMEGVAWKDAPAIHKTAIACLNYDLPGLKELECVNLLVDAAEANYLKSAITLSYLYYAGIVVEQDKLLAKELLDAVAEKLSQGEAHWQFFKLALSKEFTQDYIDVNPHQFSVSFELAERFESLADRAEYLVLLTDAINAGSETAMVFKEYYLPALIDKNISVVDSTISIPTVSNEAAAWLSKTYLTKLFRYSKLEESELYEKEETFLASIKQFRSIAAQDPRLSQHPNSAVLHGLLLEESASSLSIIAKAQYAFYEKAALKHNLLAKALLVNWLHSNQNISTTYGDNTYNFWLDNCLYHNLQVCIYVNSENRVKRLSSLSGESLSTELNEIVSNLLTALEDPRSLKLLKELAKKYPSVSAVLEEASKDKFKDML